MIRAIMILCKLDKSGVGGGWGYPPGVTPEDIAEGVVAGKYRLLFLPLKQFSIAAKVDIFHSEEMC